MDALSRASIHARPVLFSVACLAERIAKTLDDGGILANAEGHLATYADTLEQLVRVAGYESWSAQETLWKISAAIQSLAFPASIIR